MLIIAHALFQGNAGDSLRRHRGMKFSTADEDFSPGQCAASHQGGWWLADCLDSNLNGDFRTETNSETTIFWRTITKAISKTEIKIQPYQERGNY